MKRILVLVFFIFFIDCQKDTNPTVPYDERIILQTDKQIYCLDDTICFLIKNNSMASILVHTRCGIILEISYQKKLDNNWSVILELPLPECMTRREKLEPSKDLSYSISATDFVGTGTFRLLTRFNWKDEPEIFDTLYSNNFEIQNE